MLFLFLHFHWEFPILFVFWDFFGFPFEDISVSFVCKRLTNSIPVLLATFMEWYISMKAGVSLPKTQAQTTWCYQTLPPFFALSITACDKIYSPCVNHLDLILSEFIYLVSVDPQVRDKVKFYVPEYFFYLFHILTHGSRQCVRVCKLLWQNKNINFHSKIWVCLNAFPQQCKQGKYHKSAWMKEWLSVSPGASCLVMDRLIDTILLKKATITKTNSLCLPNAKHLPQAHTAWDSCGWLHESGSENI